MFGLPHNLLFLGNVLLVIYLTKLEPRFWHDLKNYFHIR